MTDKERFLIPGIYQIRNLVNGKIYIGLSRNMYVRFCGHRSRRLRTEHLSIARAIRKYGVENFAFEVLERCPVEELFEREQHWIEVLKPAYNRNGGGKGNPKPHSEATRAIISKKAKAQWACMSSIERLRIKQNLTGQPVGHAVTAETRAKLRAQLIGRKLPLSVRKKIGAANRVSMLGNRSGNKAVLQCQNGRSLLRFDSILLAARHVGVHPSGITSVLKKPPTYCRRIYMAVSRQRERNYMNELSKIGENIQLEIVPLPPSALETLERATVDLQISTAHRFPRSMQKFQERARSMALIDEDTAASCIYSRPVGGGKFAEGLSVRAAEIVGASFGNLRVGATVIEQNERYVKARGFAHDLETNFAVATEVIESTVKRDGTPYDERMRIVIAKSCLAKARRDATFQVVPKALFKAIETECRKLALGEGQSVSQRRSRIVAWITKLAIDPKRVWSVLGINGEADMTDEHFLTLTGLKTAIADGEVTIDEAFPLSPISKPVIGAPVANAAPAAAAKQPKKAGGPKKKGSLHVVEPPAPASEEPEAPAPDETEKPALGPKAQEFVQRIADAGFQLTDFLTLAVTNEWLPKPENYTGDAADLEGMFIPEEKATEFLEPDNWELLAGLLGNK